MDGYLVVAGIAAVVLVGIVAVMRMQKRKHPPSEPDGSGERETAEKPSSEEPPPEVKGVEPPKT